MEDIKNQDYLIAPGYDDFPKDITAGVIRSRVIYVVNRVFSTILVGYLILIFITMDFGGKIDRGLNPRNINGTFIPLILGIVMAILGYVILKKIGIGKDPNEEVPNSFNPQLAKLPWMVSCVYFLLVFLLMVYPLAIYRLRNTGEFSLFGGTYSSRDAAAITIVSLFSYFIATLFAILFYKMNGMWRDVAPWSQEDIVLYYNSVPQKPNGRIILWASFICVLLIPMGIGSYNMLNSIAYGGYYMFLSISTLITFFIQTFWLKKLSDPSGIDTIEDPAISSVGGGILISIIFSFIVLLFAFIVLPPFAGGGGGRGKKKKKSKSSKSRTTRSSDGRYRNSYGYRSRYYHHHHYHHHYYRSRYRTVYYSVDDYKKRQIEAGTIERKDSVGEILLSNIVSGKRTLAKLGIYSVGGFLDANSSDLLRTKFQKNLTNEIIENLKNSIKIRMQIPFLNKLDAMILSSAGFRTFEDLLNADAKHIESKTDEVVNHYSKYGLPPVEFLTNEEIKFIKNIIDRLA